MVQELVAKRNVILESIQKMHDELNEVNSEIVSEVETNNQRIAELQKEVEQLNTLKSQNVNSIKNLSKILGK
jgi:uncharacterized coiled-coil DUF342 family protein